MTPLSRRRVLDRDRAALEQRWDELETAPTPLPVFMILVPGAEEITERSCALLTPHVPVTLLLNGFSRRPEPVTPAAATAVRLSAWPGFPARHGAVLTLLLTAARGDFALVDPDCFVRQPRLLDRPRFAADELLAAPDHSHFFNLNRRTGHRFPRTHFLIIHSAVARSVMARHRIGADKYARPPRRLAPALAELGYGPRQRPRDYLAHYDTLLLLMAMALADGLRFRWLETAAGDLVHWKHAAALASRAAGG